MAYTCLREKGFIGTSHTHFISPLVAFVWTVRPKLLTIRPFTEKVRQSLLQTASLPRWGRVCFISHVAQPWTGACAEQALNRDMDACVSRISSHFYLVKIVLT